MTLVVRLFETRTVSFLKSVVFLVPYTERQECEKKEEEKKLKKTSLVSGVRKDVYVKIFYFP